MLKSFFKKFISVEESGKKSFSSTIERSVNPTDIWEIISELGDGAFGKVYKTHKRNTDLFAALKRVDFESEDELEDFMLEIDILTNFKHKNILTLHEVYIYESKLWIYLELCGGGALDSIMEALEKPLTEPQIRFVSREVLQGLEFLHEKLIIHRDMKAGNILLTLSNEVKLADFGVSAKLADEKQKRSTFIGTPYWMAPEVINCETFKDAPYNWKADIWSFGITLIELAQKRPPHNATNPTRVLLKILKSDPPTLSRPHLWSSKFKTFLGRTLQKDPNQRPECRDLLLDPFVSDVTESDRKVIQILLCEVNADIIETVEDFDPNEPIDEIDDNDLNPLILSDSTKLSIPVEMVCDDGDDDVDDHKNDVIGGEIDNSKNDHESNKNLKQINDNSGDSGVSLGQTTSENQSDSVNGNVDNRVRETIVHPKKQLNTSETTEHKSSVVNDILKDPPSSSPSATDFHDNNNKSKVVISPLKRQNSAYRTRTRTRRFVIDGQTITTTSKRIVNTNLEDKKFREDEQIKRKAALRAFRILAKQEAHQTRELNERAQQQIDILENKMNAEFSTLTKTYDHKMEIAIRNYKLQMERLDKEFEVEMKRIRTETSKEERTFKDRLKNEIDTYDRAMRKAAKRDLNKYDHIIQSNSSLTSLKSNNSTTTTNTTTTNNNNNSSSLVSQRLTIFRENQESRMNSRIYDLHNEYNKRRNLIHSEYLNEIHTLRLNFEEDKWRTEHRFLSMKHQLDRNRQLDLFMIKREQLTGRSELELTELKQTINMERSKLQAIHSIERKNCIKSMKSVHKRSILTLQRQSRLNTIQMNEAQKRMNEELELLESKQKAQTDELEKSIHFRLQELEQSTIEKRNALIDQETKRLQELDNRHQNEMRIYSESLPRIKALMKEQFAQEYKEDSFKLHNYHNYRSYSPKSHKSRLPIPMTSLTNLRWGSLSNSNTKLNHLIEPRSHRILTLFSSDLNNTKTSSTDSM
uniref:LOK-like protein kinase n=1 Tax=Schistosoma mansoni TaxID=6183 RepID=A0A5K4FCN3_SCHMA